MSLSNKTKDILEIAMANRAAAAEIAAAIDAAANAQAANVAALAAWSNLTGVDGTGDNAAPLTGTNAAFSAVYSKINAILTALKAANLMASS